MPDCNFTLRKVDPEKQERAAWCTIHERWAEECKGDPIDATLGHLIDAAKPPVKVCPHCGEPLDE